METSLFSGQKEENARKENSREEGSRKEGGKKRGEKGGRRSACQEGQEGGGQTGSVEMVRILWYFIYLFISLGKFFPQFIFFWIFLLKVVITGG